MRISRGERRGETLRSSAPRVPTALEPAEVFTAQVVFVTVLAMPVTIAVLTSLPTHASVFTAGTVLAGLSAIGASLLGSLGTNAPRVTLVVAVGLALADVIACTLLFFAAPGSGFLVLAVLPVAWVSIQMTAPVRILVLGTAVGGLVVAQAVKDVVGDQPWRLGLATIVNITLLLVLTSWAGARWTRRTRSQLRLLEAQTRLVGTALDHARTQERVIAEVLEVVDFAVVTVDPHGRTTSNRAAEALARRVGTADAATIVIDGPFYLADGTTPLPPELHPLDLSRGGSTVEHVMVHLGHPGPTQIPLSLTVRQITDHSGNRFVFVARDMTAELAEAQARDDAVAAVSHEIKTPLTSVLGYLELALDEPSIDGPTRELIEVALDNTERMLTLSQDFLAARSRTVEAGVSLVVQSCRPSEIVRQAVDGVRPAALERMVSVVVAPGSRTAIEADPLRLRQVVDNLLTNAVKYNETNGRVDVEVRDAVRVEERAGDEVEVPGIEIVVADTGRGLDEQERVGLFTPFYRTEHARGSDVPGTGLGLSIVRDIVTAHAGDVSVESALGNGTTVTVWLPAFPRTTTQQEAVA